MKQFFIFRPVFDRIFQGVFDMDLGRNNLLTEDGFALLQQDGDYILL